MFSTQLGQLKSSVLQAVEALRSNLPLIEEEEGAPPPGASTQAPSYLPHIDAFIESNAGVPSRSILLGLCSDELPVIFDLKDPRPGPLAILGDRRSGKTSLMRVIVRSAMANNPPHAVKFIVTSADNAPWRKLTRQGEASGHLVQFPGGENEQLSDWLFRITDLVEKRHDLSGTAPPTTADYALLVILDDAQIIRFQESGIQQHFEWLCKMGPSVQVWPIISLETGDALQMGRWLRHFKTRILGSMPDFAATRLGFHGDPGFSDKKHGIDFATWTTGQWLRFWLPEEPFPVQQNRDEIIDKDA